MVSDKSGTNNNLSTNLIINKNYSASANLGSNNTNIINETKTKSKSGFFNLLNAVKIMTGSVKITPQIKLTKE